MRDAPLREPEADRPAKPRLRRRLRTPGEARAWRRRIVGYALFAVALVLTVNALVGENGYLATLRAHREYDALTQRLAHIEQDSQALRDRTRRLRKDPAALEEAARDLGLIHPGETVVVIKGRAPVPSHPTR